MRGMSVGKGDLHGKAGFHGKWPSDCEIDICRRKGYFYILCGKG